MLRNAFQGNELQQLAQGLQACSRYVTISLSHTGLAAVARDHPARSQPDIGLVDCCGYGQPLRLFAVAVDRVCFILV